MTLEEASRLAVSALEKTGSPPVTILSSHIERPFGWAFFAAVLHDEQVQSDPARSPILLVNRYSRQVLLTSTAFFVQSCVDTYEAILKAHGRDWCLTLGAHSGPLKRGGLSGRFIQRELEEVGLCDITPCQESVNGR